uniref:Uncharacterized protein LOC117368810 n=1 Tax=Geotrypetes seraphini TaxID=260995 RepID=A0A6P8SI85_GEOSA|nr:uncharacterized protein LOC117368810 [Geotrypetes seraphini]
MHKVHVYPGSSARTVTSVPGPDIFFCCRCENQQYSVNDFINHKIYDCQPEYKTRSITPETHPITGCQLKTEYGKKDMERHLKTHTVCKPVTLTGACFDDTSANQELEELIQILKKLVEQLGAKAVLQRLLGTQDGGASASNIEKNQIAPVEIPGGMHSTCLQQGKAPEGQAADTTPFTGTDSENGTDSGNTLLHMIREALSSFQADQFQSQFMGQGDRQGPLFTPQEGHPGGYGSSGRQTGYSSIKKSCKKFNNGLCTWNNCRFQHACNLCGGALLASQCRVGREMTTAIAHRPLLCGR